MFLSRFVTRALFSIFDIISDVTDEPEHLTSRFELEARELRQILAVRPPYFPPDAQL